MSSCACVWPAFLCRSTTGTDRRTAASAWDQVRLCRSDHLARCLQAEWKTTDAHYGWVRLQCWSGLHPIPQMHAKRGTRQARPLVRGTLIRLEVEHLPKPTKVPVPLWLWWWGPELPDLETIWRVYVARFSIEHTFRFFKQVLKWTTPKVRSPEAADRWTWLVILAYVQLRLARPLVVDHRLPWQAPLPAEKLTPARVRRAFSHLLPMLGRWRPHQNPVDARPGAPKAGDRPRKRFPAIKLTA